MARNKVRDDTALEEFRSLTSSGFQFMVLGAFASTNKSWCLVAPTGFVKGPEPVNSACGPIGAIPTKKGLSLLATVSMYSRLFSFTRSVLYWPGAGVGGD